MKVCTKCNTEKSIFEFSKNKSHADKHDSICKDCRKIQIKTWRDNNPDKCKVYIDKWKDKHTVFSVYAYQALANKKQSGKFKIELTVDELTEIAEDTSMCPICGIQIDYSLSKGKIFDNSPSLDRKYNTLTITKNNSWVICHRCNRSKSNRSIEEFISYMEIALSRLRS